MKLHGGYCNSVYRIDGGDKSHVLKIAVGSYRMFELEREYRVLHYLQKTPFRENIPKARSFRQQENYAYLFEDFVDGRSVSSLLKDEGGAEEKKVVWYRPTGP